MSKSIVKLGFDWILVNLSVNVCGGKNKSPNYNIFKYLMTKIDIDDLDR